MMDKTKLRGADVLTSFVLIAFGIWIVLQAMQMPMTESYGGVQNVWYVAPALFPLIIGGSLILLGVGLFSAGVRSGGWSTFVSFFNRRRLGLGESGWRFFAILLPLFSLVYMNIPNLDFLLSCILFLVYFITVFYIENFTLLKRSTIAYASGMFALLVLHVSGVSKAMKSFYVTDVLGLCFLLAFVLLLRVWTRGKADERRKLRNGLIISFLVPLFLVSTFRFFLMVPMPVEGGLMDLLFIVKYAFK